MVIRLDFDNPGFGSILPLDKTVPESGLKEATSHLLGEQFESKSGVKLTE